MKKYFDNGRCFFWGVILGFGTVFPLTLPKDDSFWADSAYFADDAARVKITQDDPNANNTQMLKSDLSELAAMQNPTDEQYATTIHDAVTVVSDGQAVNEDLDAEIEKQAKRIAAVEAAAQASNDMNMRLQEDVNSKNDYIYGDAGGKVLAGSNAEAGDSGLSNLGLSFVVILPTVLAAGIGAFIWQWWKNKKQLENLSASSAKKINEKVTEFCTIVVDLGKLYFAKDLSDEELAAMGSNADVLELKAIDLYVRDKQNRDGLSLGFVDVLIDKVSEIVERIPEINGSFSSRLKKLQPATFDGAFTQKDLDAALQGYEVKAKRNVKQIVDSARAAQSVKVRVEEQTQTSGYGGYTNVERVSQDGLGEEQQSERLSQHSDGFDQESAAEVLRITDTSRRQSTAVEDALPDRVPPRTFAAAEQSSHSRQLPPPAEVPSTRRIRSVPAHLRSNTLRSQ